MDDANWGFFKASMSGASPVITSQPPLQFVATVAAS